MDGREEVNNGGWALCFHRGGEFVCLVAPISFGAVGVIDRRRKKEEEG